MKEWLSWVAVGFILMGLTLVTILVVAFISAVLIMMFDILGDFAVVVILILLTPFIVATLICMVKRKC